VGRGSMESVECVDTAPPDTADEPFLLHGLIRRALLRGVLCGAGFCLVFLASFLALDPRDPLQHAWVIFANLRHEFLMGFVGGATVFLDGVVRKRRSVAWSLPRFLLCTVALTPVAFAAACYDRYLAYWLGGRAFLVSLRDALSAGPDLAGPAISVAAGWAMAVVVRAHARQVSARDGAVLFVVCTVFAAETIVMTKSSLPLLLLLPFMLWLAERLEGRLGLWLARRRDEAPS